MDDEQLAQWIEQLAHDIENHASESTAALALREAAVAGADIRSAIGVLVRAIDEATQVPILEPAADALAIHLLQTDQLERLWELTDRLRWGSYLADALCRAAARGVDLSSIVPRLCGPAAKRPARIDPLRVLNAYIGCDAKKLVAVTELLGEHDRPFLIRLIRDHLLPRSGLDVSGALPILVGALEDGDPAVVREATWVTYLAAEAGMDLRRLFSALECLLTTPDEEARTRAAYSLACAQVRSGDWLAFERLRRHADGLVRREAAHALCVALHADQGNASEILARLCTALVDSNAAVRDLASSCLFKAHRDGRSITPPAEVVDALLPGLRDPALAGDLAQYLSLVCMATPDAATRWQGMLAAATEGNVDPAVARLRKLGNAGEAPEPPCPLCLRLPRHAIWNHEWEEPSGLSELRRKGEFWFCPTCRSVYRKSYESEWEDMSFAETWTADRLSPTAARRSLAGDDKAWLEKNYARLLQEAVRSLDHPLQPVREEAAWVLAEHHLDAGTFVEMAEILRHPDHAVRTIAAGCLDSHHCAQPMLVLPPSLIGVLLADSCPAVRRTAAMIEVRQCWRLATREPILALLCSDDPVIITPAIEELRRASGGEPDLTPFVADLLPLAGHRSADVRRAADWALRGASKTAEQCRVLVATYQRMLSAQSIELRNEGADHLRDLASGGVDIGAALPALAPMLRHRKLAWHANAAVKAAVGQGTDAGPVLDAIIAGLGRANMDGDVDFAQTLQLAARAGQDIRRALPTIARRIISGNETLQAALVHVVRELDAAGVAVAGVSDELERALPKLEPYLREYLTPILFSIWLNRNAWPRMSAFIRRRLYGTESCACEALRAAGARGVDIAPLVVDLVCQFESRNAHLRGYPLKTLEEYFARSKTALPAVVAALRAVRASTERDRLLAQLESNDDAGKHVAAGSVTPVDSK